MVEGAWIVITGREVSSLSFLQPGQASITTKIVDAYNRCKLLKLLLLISHGENKLKTHGRDTRKGLIVA